MSVLQIAPDSKGKPNVSDFVIPMNEPNSSKMITAEPLVLQVKAPTSSRGNAVDRKATFTSSTEVESLGLPQQPPQPVRTSSISKAELMALDEENESGGLIKCTKIATSGIFSLSVMAVDTTSTMVDEETKEEEEEVANFAVDAVQEIYAEPE